MTIWTGTVSVTNGDATFTVTAGDALNQFNCTPDSTIVIDGVVYFVLSRTDTTHGELTRNYAGTTGSKSAEISPINQTTAELLTLGSAASRLAAQLEIFDKNSQGFYYTLVGATGDADPGAGFMAFDTIDFASLTPGDVMAIYLDNVDGNGRSVANLLDTLSAGTQFVVRSLTSSSYVSLQLGTGLADSSGYRKDESAIYIGHDGVLSAAEPVSVAYFRVGQGLEIDAQGVFADRDDFDAEPEGFTYLSTDGNGTTGVATLYRKVTGGSGDWSVGAVLQGPQGEDGDQGIQGIPGSDGADGAAGDSAYDVAVAQGFVGTEADWLASLEGSDGADGADGSDGADGTDPGYLYSWNTGTSNSNLGSGYLWADADLDVATKLFVSKTNRAGDDLSQALADAVISTNPTRKANIVISRTGGNAQARVSITALVDHTGYVEYTIAASSHAGTDGFLLNDAVSLQINQVGNQGSTGPGGGDVVGPGTSVAGELVKFTDTDGLEIEGTGIDFGDVSKDSDNLAFLDNKTEARDNLSLKGTNIASATTTDLSTATGHFLHITGATTITGLGTAPAGVERHVTFDGALTLTHNATSLILPGGANITTAAGDTADFISEGSGNWRCASYSPASGQPVATVSTAKGGTGSTTVDGARLGLVVPTYVATRTAMKALDVTKDLVAILTEAGREGTFKWDSSNLSSKIAPASVTSTAVNSTTEVITKTAHGLITGQAVIPTSSVDGLTADTLYYVIRVDADTFKLASTRANAIAGTAFNLTGTTNVTLKTIPDDLEGLYVVPTGKARDGSQGAYARAYSGLPPITWWGCVPNAGSDQTEAVLAAFIVAQSSTLHVPSGVYISGPIAFLTALRLRGDGPYSSQFTLKSGSSGDFIIINNATKIELDGIGFNGDKTNNASGAECIRIQGTQALSDHVIRNCGFFNGKTDGLGQAGTYTGLIIDGCVAQGNTQDGFSISSATDCHITGNRLDSNGRFGVVVTAARNRVEGNSVTSNGSSGILISSTSFAVVNDNEAVSNTGHGIQFNTVTDGVMSANTSHSNGISGLDSYASPRTTITGNTSYGNTVRGIEVDSASDNNLVSGNNCWSNGDVDISVFRSQDAQLVGNNGSVRLWDSASVSSAAVSAGGSGYAVGNVLTVVGGTKGTAATLTVATLSGSAVATVTVSNAGDYWTFPTNPVSVTGGAGTGATFTLTPVGANSGTCSGVVINGGGTDKALTVISGAASGVRLNEWMGTVSDAGLHIVSATGCPSYTVPLTLLTLGASWVAYDTNWQAPAYRKTSEGVVHLYGSMKSGTTTAGTVIGTLPAGFRPAKVEGPFYVYGESGIVSFYVSSNGEITAQSPLNSTRTALDGISFKVA